MHLLTSRGRWNFYSASPISVLVGQKGQANYSAANVFLDAFASYRLGQGLGAHSVNPNAIEDVGYVAEQGGMQIISTIANEPP